MARPKARLRNIGDVLTELARQYRRANRGELDWADAHCASRILRELRLAMESGDLEQRLARIERQLAEAQQQPAFPDRPNGHAHP